MISRYGLISEHMKLLRNRVIAIKRKKKKNVKSTTIWAKSLYISISASFLVTSLCLQVATPTDLIEYVTFKTQKWNLVYVYWWISYWISKWIRRGPLLHSIDVHWIRAKTLVKTGSYHDFCTSHDGGTGSGRSRLSVTSESQKMIWWKAKQKSKSGNGQSFIITKWSKGVDEAMTRELVQRLSLSFVATLCTKNS